MANKTLFGSWVGRWLPPADAANSERAPAYALSPREALAQVAMTGCLRDTFYESAQQQLQAVLALCAQVEPSFIARVAVVARERGHMKDLPAVLCAVLAARQDPHLEPAFARAIDTPRMLRSFVQVVRSGVTGRKSLGTRPRRLVREWFAARPESAIFRGSVGASPSLADVVRLAHPRPDSPARAALYAWLLGRAHDASALPEVVREFEAFKRDRTRPVPDVPFEMLTALDLSGEHWAAIALRASWNTTRLNLNTFARHGVFGIDGMPERIAARIAARGAVRHARALPHSILAAIGGCDAAVPVVVRGALEAALEESLWNVPRMEGDVVICPDLSGSMSSPVSGRFGGATTAVRCIDVAALFTAALLRANPRAEVLPFAECVRPVPVRAVATLTETTRALASRLGGGTNCSAPLAWLRERGRRADVVILVSDNESWLDARRPGATELQRQWEALRARNPRARLVCLDLQPSRTTQAPGRDDVLNLGGFSDAMFETIARFTGEGSPRSWVESIERVDL